jgi:hypothetical protein
MLAMCLLLVQLLLVVMHEQFGESSSIDISGTGTSGLSHHSVVFNSITVTVHTYTHTHTHTQITIIIIIIITIMQSHPPVT